MKNLFKTLFIFMAATSVLVGCKSSEITKDNPIIDPTEDNEYLEAFLAMSDPSVVKDSVVLTKYDKTTDQIVRNDSFTSYMVASAAGDKFYSLSIDTGSNDGATIDQDALLMVSTSAYGIEGIEVSDLLMEVVKKDSDLAWLWNDDTSYGVIIQL